MILLLIATFLLLLLVFYYMWLLKIKICKWYREFKSQTFNEALCTFS